MPRERLNQPERRERSPALETIEQLESGLRIDQHALDDALLQQPDFFYRVARRLALAISQRDAAKQALAEVEAIVDGGIRQAMAAREERATEKEVESRRRLHRDVKQATDNLLSLNQQVGELSALKEAFMQRSYVLKDLVSLHLSNYFGAGENRADTRNAQADRTRRDMREHYRGRD